MIMQQGMAMPQAMAMHPGMMPQGMSMQAPQGMTMQQAGETNTLH